MLDVRVTRRRGAPEVLALAVARPPESEDSGADTGLVTAPDGVAGTDPTGDKTGPVKAGKGSDADGTRTEPADDPSATGLPLIGPDVLDAATRELIERFIVDAEHNGAAGVVRSLPLPGGTPHLIQLVGIGEGTIADWRAAGAALVRATQRPRLTCALPPDVSPESVGGFTEGLLLGSYRYQAASTSNTDTGTDTAKQVERVDLLVSDKSRYTEAVAHAEAIAEATSFARDMTNTPSAQKSPAWLAKQFTRAATRYGVEATVLGPEELARDGFGGILAVGGGSAHPPRLVELRWRPRKATRHVVLIGKGITFDTGGISIKPVDGMRLMRKDMGGAAAIIGAVIGAARLKLPVKVTALAPLAENMPSGDAYRPGDVIRHYGGMTTEVLNTDAEGRMVLADALAYASQRLRPDVLIDLATLTGAQNVALGKRTAALFSENDALANQLIQAAEAAGERVWRLPLVEDYMELLRSDIADQTNAPGGPGSIMAALFLRPFTGQARDRWVHIDMSAPAWSDSADKELSKLATGWGVRTLLHWLSDLD